MNSRADASMSKVAVRRDNLKRDKFVVPLESQFINILASYMGDLMSADLFNPIAFRTWRTKKSDERSIVDLPAQKVETAER